MIATLAYAMCLGTVKRNIAVTKPAVSYKTYATMDQAFLSQRLTGLA